jgi:hypothetical protein
MLNLSVKLFFLYFRWKTSPLPITATIHAKVQLKHATATLFCYHISRTVTSDSNKQLGLKRLHSRVRIKWSSNLQWTERNNSLIFLREAYSTRSTWTYDHEFVHARYFSSNQTAFQPVCGEISLPFAIAATRSRIIFLGFEKADFLFYSSEKWFFRSDTSSNLTISMVATRK